MMHRTRRMFRKMWIAMIRSGERRAAQQIAFYQYMHGRKFGDDQDV